MTDLTAWLLERIAEDEAVVAEAGAPLGRVDSELVECDTYAYRYHIAAARVLAECAAKRRVLYLSDAVDGEVRNLAGTGVEDFAGVRRSAVDVVLRALASVYADHPDYRSEWS